MSCTSPELHCKVCNRPEHAEDMVACDTCGTWFHYSCAGVQDSICNKPWYCGYCPSRKGSSVCDSGSSLKTSSTNARLRLRQLEESKALDDRLQLQQAERERAYLAEKHRLEAECFHSGSGGGSHRSVRSRQSCKSRRSYRSEVQTWINQSMDTPPRVEGQQVGASTSTPVISTGNGVLKVPTNHLEPPRSDFPVNQQMVVQSYVASPSQVPSTATQAPTVLQPTTHMQTAVPTVVTVSNTAPLICDQVVTNSLGHKATAPLSKSQRTSIAAQLMQPSLQHTTASRQSGTIIRGQREQHPPCPFQQPLQPTNLSGIKEPSLSINVPVMESQVPIQPREDRVRMDAIDLQRKWTHQQHTQTQPQHKVQQQQQNTSSQPVVGVGGHQQYSSNQVPVSSSVNVPPPMNFYQPSYYTGWPAASGNNVTHHVSGIAPGELPYIPAPQVPQGFRSNQLQPVQLQASNHYQWPTAGTEGILSAQQLAARQVVSRELPKFSGDPLEWPMFINAFESTTVMCGIQPDENLSRLQKSLVGSAREKVLSILTLPAAIPEIIETLRDECGRPEQLVHCLLLKIRNAPPPNANKLETLITFGREVRNLVTYIEGARLQDHLSNPMLMLELVGKLPPNLRLDWGLHTQRIPQVSLKAFSEYVSSIKTAACHVSLPAESSNLDESYRKGKKREKGSFVNTHSIEGESKNEEAPKRGESFKQETRSDPKPCHACNRVDHRLRNCDKFTGFNVDQRKRLVEQFKLCQRCLGSHGKWPCRTKQSCGVDGCKESHNRLLHSGNPKSVKPIESGSSTAFISAHCYHQASTLFKVVPVVLSNNGKTVTTFAFLDDGSSLTLMEQEVANELGLTGEASPLCLQWTGNVTRKEPLSQRVRLQISSVNNGTKHTISDVQTVSSLDLPQQSLDYDELSEQYPHLQGIPVRSFSCAVPQILIGLDNAKLNLTLKKRERRSGEPVAAKTRLGWTIFGGGRKGAQDAQHVMVHACGCSADAALHDLVKDYFAVESMGINPTLPLESPEDQRARHILQQTTKRTESGRFECGLLWKSDDFEFPKSYAMAERRLVCLEKKLGKDPDLKQKVAEQIEEYLERGYAHIATDDELRNSDPSRVWYLPLGVVQNPRKPGKVRIVWDAAARVGDVSLNSMLLAGPDLLTPLLKVMCGFRQRQYVSVGDVRQMFHQLLVRVADRQALRFLFRPSPAQAPIIYVMNVVIFGASCSPCLAQHVKNVNAREFEEQCPEAVAAIINNTYVDDFLDSRDTIDEAVKIVEEVRMIYSKAGFEIRNWQSNSEEILQRVGVDAYDAAKRFSVEKTTTAERVLGMAWIPKDDKFVFAAQFREDLIPLLSGDIVPTKRQILRVVMSHFDPLGIVASYTVHGKILIQDVWRSGVKWDDPITDEDFVTWQRWVTLVPKLSEVEVPRCYFPNYVLGSYDSLEVHVFVDASLMAYCATAYFRIIDDGVPRCSLVAAKTKVTPLKPQSIPRNELNAGVIGVRLLRSIEENHTIPVQKRYIWTDSKPVLAWCRADPRKYRQYVAFRVAEILTETSIDEWNYVPSRLNIADKGTKWGSGPCLDPISPWFKGPQFLRGLESGWPPQQSTFSDPVEEVREVHHHQEKTQTTFDFTRFSRWEDLQRSLGYLYHFVHRCRAKDRLLTQERVASLEQEDYVAAETSLWRMVQRQEYAEELSILQKNSELQRNTPKFLKKTNPLAKISPFIDDEGVLRMQSRISLDTAYYSFDFRNPVIIPRANHVTNLLIHNYHQRYGHANVDTVINELRQRYYIPKIRFIVKKVVRQCMWCRVYRAKPEAPRMAALPQPRVTPYVRPFTFTGLDYFGPLIVKRGRSNEKRWVALFTCLTVRAVHVEVVRSMSAASCKMAIRRFVARRGAPQQIFSDNGTNFRGAARELADEIRIINREIAPTFTNAETEWIFNPPSAPHMGGVWERKVRSIKEAFKSLYHKNRLDDEELVTFLAEAEMIVNSHPLTFVPLENSTEEAVTPNNFLLMSSSGANTAAKIPADEEVPLRRNWKLMEHLLNQFWKRWIQAYLPTIARRTKWFNDVRPLQDGDPVIVVDEAVRNGWLRGRVIKTYPGKDGQVRKVDVQTSSGLLQRPAIKVALLDVLESSKAIQG